MYNIVAIDLGWGGLLQAYNVFKNIERFSGKAVNIIFVRLPIFKYDMTDQDKVDQFELYLNNITKRFEPEELIIACNTLSGLYPNTSFSLLFKKNVYNIIEITSECIISNYEEGSKILIFASELTMSERFYHKRLLESGICEENIICIPLKGLARLIEEELYSKELPEKINQLVLKLFPSIDNYNKMFVVLGCTHYEYVTKIFFDVLKTKGISNLYLVDAVYNALFICNKGQDVKKNLYIYSYNSGGNITVKNNLKRYFDSDTVNSALDKEKIIHI